MSQQSARKSQASQTSIRSVGSRHSYKTVSHHSAVDESLFGESYREKKLRENRDNRSKSLSPGEPYQPALHSPDLVALTAVRQKPEVVQVTPSSLLKNCNSVLFRL